MEKNEATEINDVAPSSLSHLIGQRGVIDQVRVAIDAAQMDNKKFDHALLVGPPGMGKSALAAVIAQEMATDFHEVLGQSIKNNADLNVLLLAAKDKDIVHIDECHELAKEFQTALYLAVDKRKLIIQGGKTPMTLPLADFSLLLSTTDEYGLLQPCRDRMKLLLRFQFYEEADLIEVLRHRSKALRWTVGDVVLPEIAKARKERRDWHFVFCNRPGAVQEPKVTTAISLEHLHQACALEQIDNLGLGPTERKYLAILTNGATRLNVLASMLGLPSRTVSEVTEPFLVRAGLIIKDDQGRRQLTQKGMDHCQHWRQVSVRFATKDRHD